MAFQKSKKRRSANKDENDSDSDTETRTLTGNWPRWLVVESGDKDKPITALSPFAIDKGFRALAGTLKSVKRLRDGTFLVECDRKMQSDLLLKSQILVDRPVKITAHHSLNSSKGVIRCRDLTGMSDLEIKEELTSQGVTHVSRATIKKGDQRVPTNTLFLTFCNPTLPRDIRVGYLRVKVDLFVPSPMRCFQCQKFGHGASRCSAAAVCPKCAEVHEGQCTKSPKCVNCAGPHASSSKDCTVWKTEQAIQKVKAEKNLSYPEAKKEVLSRNVFGSSSAPTFASVVAKKMVSSCVQTDLTWVKGDNPLLSKGVVIKPQTTQSGTGTQTQTTKLSSKQQQQTVRSSQATPGCSTGKDSVIVIEGVKINSAGFKAQTSISAPSKKQHSKTGTKKPPGPYQEIERQKKMETDAVKVFNRFECLSDDEMSEDCPEIDGGKTEASSTTRKK